MNIVEKFSYLLPAFPPQDFDVDGFIVELIKSELETLSLVRKVVREYGKDIPKDIKLLTDRIEYLIKNPLTQTKS